MWSRDRRDIGSAAIDSHERLALESIIAKNRNSYAKRQREFEKKQRADDKRLKRERKKEQGEPSKPAEAHQFNH